MRLINYHTDLLYLTFSVAVGCMVIGCEPDSASPDTAEAPIYQISIGTELVDITDGFGTHQEPRGGDGQEISLSLNGHPIPFKCEENTSSLITQFIRKGSNNIHVLSADEFNAYLQIVRLDEDGRAVLLQESVSGNPQDQKVWDFDCSLQVTNAINVDQLMVETKEQRQATQQQLLIYLEKLHRSIVNIEADEVAEIMLVYYDQWAPRMGVPQSHLEQIRANIEIFIRDYGGACQPLEYMNIKFLYGSSSVYVYAGWEEYNDGASYIPYLLVFDDGESVDIRRWPIRYVKIKGDWQIMQAY